MADLDFVIFYKIVDLFVSFPGICGSQFLESIRESYGRNTSECSGSAGTTLPPLWNFIQVLGIEDDIIWTHILFRVVVL